MSGTHTPPGKTPREIVAEVVRGLPRNTNKHSWTVTQDLALVDALFAFQAERKRIGLCLLDPAGKGAQATLARRSWLATNIPELQQFKSKDSLRAFLGGKATPDNTGPVSNTHWRVSNTYTLSKGVLFPICSRF